MCNLEVKHLTTRQIPNIEVLIRGPSERYALVDTLDTLDIQVYAEMIQFMNHIVDTGLDPALILEQQYTKFIGSAKLFNKADPVKYNIEFQGDEYVCMVLPNIIQSNPMNFLPEPGDTEPTIVDAIVMYFQDSRPTQPYSPLRPTRIHYLYARDSDGGIANNNTI